MSVRGAYLACLVMFAWALVQFYEPTTGFTNLIMIGDAIKDRQVTQLRVTPHYVYEDSAGYDGAYYAQLALNPTLSNPELAGAIDNLQYRARRILFCWTAWVAGLGRPAWVLQAFALLNGVCWFGLAWVLMRWFPPNSWENFLRWFAVMFSHGLCMSVRHSLSDGPSLLLVALGLAAWEDGRRRSASGWLALAGLGRETSLLATAGLAPANLRDWAGWRRCLAALWPAALPLFAWVLYLRWRFGAPSESGLNNFTLPLAGLVEKWGATWKLRSGTTDELLWWGTLATVAAITVQILFFVLRWRTAELWWRVGAVFAGLSFLISTPVWEGFPGAAGRALLPMTLAFNILVPRGRRWLPVLIAGNLSVLAGFKEFTPPREFYTVSASGELAAQVRVERTGNWYGAENDANFRWRWSSGQAGLRLHNGSAQPVLAVIKGHASPAVDERRLRISASPAPGDESRKALVWSGELGKLPTAFQFGITVPPGDTIVSFATDRPPHPIGSDPRMMAFSISNLEILFKPATAQK